MSETNKPLQVTWIDRGFEPSCKPNPAYPNGQDIDASDGAPSCFTELPYTAKRCGYLKVDCVLCKLSVLLTTAGRPDDPRSLRLKCNAIPGIVQ